MEEEEDLVGIDFEADLEVFEFEVSEEEEEDLAAIEFKHCEDDDGEVDEMTSPRVLTLNNAADGTSLQGVVFGGGEVDVCPICFDPWSTDGVHRICCLPCGHIYGLSCINKWLQRAQSSGRCPKSNGLCTLNDVRLLYTTRLCGTDHKASTTLFPFTKQGFEKFNRYVSRKRIEALELQVDEVERKTDATVKWRGTLKLAIDALRRRDDVLERWRNALGMQIAALEHLADALERRADKLERRSEAWKRRADALERLAVALERQADAWVASMDFFGQMLK